MSGRRRQRKRSSGLTVGVDPLTSSTEVVRRRLLPFLKKSAPRATPNAPSARRWPHRERRLHRRSPLRQGSRVVITLHLYFGGTQQRARTPARPDAPKTRPTR